MLSRKEFKILSELDKDNLTKKFTIYSNEVTSMYNNKLLEYKTKFLINKLDESICEKDVWGSKYTKKELDELSTLSRLLDRNLILKDEHHCTIHDDIKKKKEDYKINIFKITDYGYNSLLEYKQQYKFWIPIIISIVAAIISIYSLF